MSQLKLLFPGAYSSHWPQSSIRLNGTVKCSTIIYKGDHTVVCEESSYSVCDINIMGSLQINGRGFLCVKKE